MSWELLLLALLGGLLRIAPPLVCAVVGDCLTQRAGRFNLGLEGIIPCTAVAAVAAGAGSGSATVAVLAAVACGGLLGLLCAACCCLPRSNEIAVGIAFLVGGTALAQFVGTAYLATVPLSLPQFSLELELMDRVHLLGVSWLLLLVLAAAVMLRWALGATRAGLLLRAAGTAAAANFLALSGRRRAVMQLLATSCGGAMAGLAGAHLALFHPGGWSNALATGLGISAVTIVFIVRARIGAAILLACMFAAIIALGLTLQIAAGTSLYHFFNILPFILALTALGWRGRPA